MDDGDLFAERVLQVIDEGQRTATYKLALLLSLIDACAEHVDSNGRAPETLHTRTIAAHALRLYFPQVRIYLSADGQELQLRQIANNNSAVIGAVLGLHLSGENAGVRTLGAVRRVLPADYEACLDKVERTFARFPILLLQVVGTSRPFLYDTDWNQSVSLKALHSPGGGLVRFREGASDHLLRLAPLFRPLIELHWTRQVAKFNRVAVEEDRLRTHLFGAERVTFPQLLRDELRHLQGGRCFYCNQTLPARIEVDHFLPWSRWPNDAIENLVLADSCNGRKSDYVPAYDHVDRWASRLEHHSDALETIAEQATWPSDGERSLALARSCYRHLPQGTPMWSIGSQFELDSLERITARLRTVS